MSDDWDEIAEIIEKAVAEARDAHGDYAGTVSDRLRDAGWLIARAEQIGQYMPHSPQTLRAMKIIEDAAALLEKRPYPVKQQRIGSEPAKPYSPTGPADRKPTL